MIVEVGYRAINVECRTYFPLSQGAVLQTREVDVGLAEKMRPCSLMYKGTHEVPMLRMLLFELHPFRSRSWRPA